MEHRVPPSDFVAQLARECPHLRIRWSKGRGEWHIEQKVGRAALPPLRIDEVDDRFIRARDGYQFVCAVRPGTKMPCGVCGLDMQVPVLKFARLTCAYCMKKATDPRTPPKERKIFRTTVGYFPLGEALLEHLRKTDPYRGGTERQEAELKLFAERKAMSELRERLNHGEACFKDHWNFMHNTQSVGYTGFNRIIHRSKL